MKNERFLVFVWILAVLMLFYGAISYVDFTKPEQGFVYQKSQENLIEYPTIISNYFIKPPFSPEPESIQLSDQSIKKEDEKENELIEIKDTGILNGTVKLISGNCMPVICEELPCETSCSEVGVSRNVYIRSIYSSQMRGVYLIDKENTELILETKSDLQGNFSVSLPVGYYSVFVEDQGMEYCNNWNDLGACPVYISKDIINQQVFKIDKAAW